MKTPYVFYIYSVLLLLMGISHYIQWFLNHSLFHKFLINLQDKQLRNEPLLICCVCVCVCIYIYIYIILCFQVWTLQETKTRVCSCIHWPQRKWPSSVPCAGVSHYIVCRWFVLIVRSCRWFVLIVRNGCRWFVLIVRNGCRWFVLIVRNGFQKICDMLDDMASLVFFPSQE